METTYTLCFGGFSHSRCEEVATIDLGGSPSRFRKDEYKHNLEVIEKFKKSQHRRKLHDETCPESCILSTSRQALHEQEHS